MACPTLDSGRRAALDGWAGISGARRERDGLSIGRGPANVKSDQRAVPAGAALDDVRRVVGVVGVVGVDLLAYLPKLIWVRPDRRMQPERTQRS